MDWNWKGPLSDWQRRHSEAFCRPRKGFEESLKTMLCGWRLYADSHLGEFGSTVGGDYVLGPEWARIGRALLGLLNGEAGRFDCGTLDGWIREQMEKNGVDDDQE